MPSLKVSQKGLAQVKQAISQKGWKVCDDRWLVEASKILEPDGSWQVDGPYAYGCSLPTWERFLQGIAIRDRSFVAFCQALAIHPAEVAETNSYLREDWGNAPEAPTFYGRELELKTLEGWIAQEHCRLISIVGFTGIGKTRLVRGALDRASSQLTSFIREEFNYLIWRRLNAQPIQSLLSELITVLSNHRETHLPQTKEDLIDLLLQYLKQHRCLLILDSAESILQGGDCAGCYRPGYEAYEDLIHRLGETAHQSCTLLLSREKLRDIEDMEGLYPVRSLTLNGLDTAAVQRIFQVIGYVRDSAFDGSPQDWETLVSIYGGNPMLLETAARHILRRFDGSLPAFLQQNLTVFGKIRSCLDWHFDRLSEVQKEIMYQLASSRALASMTSLKKNACSSFFKRQVPEILDNLERQIPLKKVGNCFTVQPVFIEYMNEGSTPNTYSS